MAQNCWQAAHDHGDFYSCGCARRNEREEKKVKLQNLTPHQIVIIDPDTKGKTSLPPSGQVARVTLERVRGADILPGVATYETRFGALEGLPPEEPGTLYVASLLAAQAAHHLGRRDIYSPGELLRDEAGQPVGCVGLTIPL